MATKKGNVCHDRGNVDSDHDRAVLHPSSMWTVPAMTTSPPRVPQAHAAGAAAAAPAPNNGLGGFPNGNAVSATIHVGARLEDDLITAPSLSPLRSSPSPPSPNAASASSSSSSATSTASVIRSIGDLSLRGPGPPKRVRFGPNVHIGEEDGAEAQPRWVFYYSYSSDTNSDLFLSLFRLSPGASLQSPPPPYRDASSSKDPFSASMFEEDPSYSCSGRRRKLPAAATPFRRREAAADVRREQEEEAKKIQISLSPGQEPRIIFGQYSSSCDVVEGLR